MWGYLDIDDDGRAALVIERDGMILSVHRDGGEPEDRYFSRDWEWVRDALEQAYQFGLDDGRAEK